jgi:hypothetical protein
MIIVLILFIVVIPLMSFRKEEHLIRQEEHSIKCQKHEIDKAILRAFVEEYENSGDSIRFHDKIRKFYKDSK